MTSPTSPNVIFNRSHSNNRYHPYTRPYCPSNELETYSFDNNNNTVHHAHSHHPPTSMQTYDTSAMSYDYNLSWTNPSSSAIETNEMTMEGPIPHSANIGGTGRVNVRFFVEYRNRFIHSKVLLVVSNDVYQLTKKNVVGHNRSIPLFPIFVRRFPMFNQIQNYPR